MSADGKFLKANAEAKLAAVREWIERECRPTGEKSEVEYDTFLTVRRAILTILDPEPARATADEDARGEKEA